MNANRTLLKGVRLKIVDAAWGCLPTGVPDGSARALRCVERTGPRRVQPRPQSASRCHRGPLWGGSRRCLPHDSTMSRRTLLKGVTHIFIHSAQSDQIAVVDFFGRHVLPRIAAYQGGGRHRDTRCHGVSVPLSPLEAPADRGGDAAGRGGDGVGVARRRVGRPVAVVLRAGHVAAARRDRLTGIEGVGIDDG